MLDKQSIERAMRGGIATGMRSLSPLALTSLALSRGSIRFRHAGPLDVLSRPLIARMLWCGAGFEFVGDKLPSAPARTRPLLLLWRVGIGATVGAALVADAGNSPLEGAIWGSVGAVLGAYGGWGMRTALTAVHLPDQIGAFAEDGGALWLASSAVRAGKVR